MKSSEILREAAMLVERGTASLGCDAIARASGNRDNYIPPHKPMAWFRLVGPSRRPEDETWWGRIFGAGIAYYRSDLNRNARIIGLCLAAAIAESEGD